MSIKPILFSAPMICALLDGRKTQTRRVLKIRNGQGLPNLKDKPEWAAWNEGRRTPYAPGDLLWVREAHAIVGNLDPGRVLYRASGYESECNRHGFDKPYPDENEVRWMPSIYMPRWASRLTLEVTEVRVQRLQDISEGDAQAEGLFYQESGEAAGFWFDGPDMKGARGDGTVECYERLWESINGPGSWGRNDFVAAYTFKVHLGNVDAMKESA